MTQNLAESKNPIPPDAAERVHTRLAAEEILRNQVPVPYCMVGSSNNFSKKAINLEYFTLKYGIFIILIQFYSYIDIGYIKKFFVLFINHTFLNQITNRKRMIVPVFIILVVVSLIMDLKKTFL